ncbi:MAG: hypothetical protein JNM90_01820 [Burkholderiales bacterium]|nr:hypothetical protein [Burkholderiales bacterium]
MGQNKVDAVKAGADSASVAVEPEARLRRRELLKGVAGGSALLAAVQPIETLAQTQTVILKANGQRCSISGMQSAGASVKPAHVICGGYSPGYYQFPQRWRLFDAGPRYYVLVNGIKYYTNTPAKTLFTKFAGASTTTLIQILPPGVSSADEVHWLTALLNAQNSVALGLNYPYTTTQIMQFYNSTGTTYTDALAFFKTLENL